MGRAAKSPRLRNGVSPDAAPSMQAHAVLGRFPGAIKQRIRRKGPPLTPGRSYFHYAGRHAHDREAVAVEFRLVRPVGVGSSVLCALYQASTIRLRIAYRTSAAVEERFSLRMIEARCVSTVLTLMLSKAAICLLV